MLNLLSVISLASSLNLLPGMPSEPPKADKHAVVAPAKAVPEKAAHEAAPEKASSEKKATPEKALKHGSVAVPEAEAPEKVAPAPAPRPIRRPRPVVKTEEAKHLVEAEARSSKLISENAKLQEAIAQKSMIPYVEIKTPEAALLELKGGNARFAEGRRVRSLLASQDPALREALSKGQAPFSVIVTCSDSRLMDNYIFDQELGRLFTIREAGKCLDTQGLASVEYAVEHLGSKLVILLGHTGCGAVKAVTEAHGKLMPGNLWSLQAAMAGLHEATPEDPNDTEADHLRRLERNNAVRQAQVLLDRSEIVRHLVDTGKVKVLPAVYDLVSGKVSFLELPKASKGAEKAHH